MTETASTASEHDAHVRDFEFFTRSFTWVESRMEDDPAEQGPAPRRRQITGRSALRVDDVTR